MSGVYGNMLSYFPELTEEIEVYRQYPNIGSGYTTVPNSDFKVRGVFQNTEGAAINTRDSYTRGVASTGTGAGVAAVIDSFEFWSDSLISLQDCYTFYEGYVYHFMKNASYKQLGGFYAYEMRKVVGEDGIKVSDALTFERGVY